MVTDIQSIAAPIATEEHLASRVAFSSPWKTIASLMISDAFAVTISLVLASVLRDQIWRSTGYPVSDTIPPAMLLVLCSFLSAGLYSGVSFDKVEEVRRLCLSIALAFLTLVSASFFLHDLSLSRAVYVLACILCVGLLPVLRAVTRGVLSRKSWWGSPVVILGHGTTGKLLLNKLKENPGIGLRPYAVLDDNPEQLGELDETVVRGDLSECREIAMNHRISYGIVCMPHLSREELLALLARYGQCFAHVLVIPNLIGMTSLGVSARNIGGIVGLELKQELLRPTSRFLKRVLDLVISVLVAPIVLPIIALAALLVLIEGRLTERTSSVFYRCERVGLRGEKFKVWKIRSMVLNGEAVLHDYLQRHPSEREQWNITQKLKHDPRITRIGRIIRKASIDELPQFWNVWIGEMSVVGPRPIQVNQIAMYGPSFSLYKQVRPGITGLWQVSGRNRLTFVERVMLDQYVIQNWSVWLDIYVLALTARVVIMAEGAY